MASIKAILAGATHYTYFNDRKMDGVALSGPLGQIAVWENGQVEFPDNSFPGAMQACYCNPPSAVDEAKRFAGKALAKARLEGKPWALI